MSRSNLHALELGPQAFDFVALHAAGYGLLQCLALPAAQQRGRDVLGTGHVALTDSVRYLGYITKILLGAGESIQEDFLYKVGGDRLSHR